MKKINHFDINTPSFWNNKYNSNQDAWDLKSTTPIFKNWSSKLNKNKPQTICIPGCGKGYDALYLASKGHNVYAIDFSSSALSYLKRNNIYSNLTIIQSDFFNLSDEYFNYFDIIIEYTFFCAIDISKRSNYVNISKKILKSGGSFVGIIFPINYIHKDDGPPFKVDMDIFEHLFSQDFILKKKEYNNLSIKSRKNNEIFYHYVKK